MGIGAGGGIADSRLPEICPVSVAPALCGIRLEIHLRNITLTRMEQGKVYNVPREVWFYSITQRDTRVIYVQDSNCSSSNSTGGKRKMSCPDVVLGSFFVLVFLIETPAKPNCYLGSNDLK